MPPSAPFGARPAVGGVTVQANAEQDASSIAVGFNSGPVALNVFTGDDRGLCRRRLDHGVEPHRQRPPTPPASPRPTARRAYGSQSAWRGLHRAGERTRPKPMSATSSIMRATAPRTRPPLPDRRARRRSQRPSTISRPIRSAARLSQGRRVPAARTSRSPPTRRSPVIYDTTVQLADGRRGRRRHGQRDPGSGHQEIAGAIGDRRQWRRRRCRRGRQRDLVFMSPTIAETRNSDDQLVRHGPSVGALSTNEVTSYAVTAGIGGTGRHRRDRRRDPGRHQHGRLRHALVEEIGQLNQGGKRHDFRGQYPASNSSQGSQAVAAGTAGRSQQRERVLDLRRQRRLNGGNRLRTAQVAGGRVTPEARSM